jgi:hypothetical protein
MFRNNREGRKKERMAVLPHRIKIIDRSIALGKI